MRHSALEDGALERSRVHVCVEVVAAHIGKVGNVGLCNRMLCSVHCRAHFQLLKVLTEDMRHSLRARCAGLVLLCNGCDIIRVALDGRAVQIVQDPRFPPISSPPPARPGPPCFISGIGEP